MSVSKVIELSSDSATSFDDALRQGIKKAAETVKEPDKRQITAAVNPVTVLHSSFEEPFPSACQPFHATERQGL